MNSTKSDSSEKITEPTGMKRRNFLGYLGISAVGVFLLSKLPGKLFSSNIGAAISGNKLTKDKSIVVKENPYAVKRTSRNTNVKNNG